MLDPGKYNFSSLFLFVLLSQLPWVCATRTVVNVGSLTALFVVALIATVHTSTSLLSVTKFAFPDAVATAAVAVVVAAAVTVPMVIPTRTMQATTKTFPSQRKPISETASKGLGVTTCCIILQVLR